MHQTSLSGIQFVFALCDAPTAKPRCFWLNLNTRKLNVFQSKLPGSFSCGFDEVAVTSHRVYNTLLPWSYRQGREKPPRLKPCETLPKLLAPRRRNIEC
jgi:hypothetical protein